MKLWQGMLSGEVDEKVNDFNSSISVDYRMVQQDIQGSIAHATMLESIGVLSFEEMTILNDELNKISEEIKNGHLLIDKTSEDIHTFIESNLTQRIGNVGKKLHTARSRNDQVTLDTRMYLKTLSLNIEKQLVSLINTLVEQSEKTTDVIMPGYTHMQRAQPVSFAHHCLAYCQMFLRDLKRLNNAVDLMDEMPLGSGAISTTTYPLDRELVCSLLGFSRCTQNSMDGVSDRDFCIELASVLSLIMMHLSRFCEEIILWCTYEFRFITLSDAYSTGSSIMPQKKNPDVAELIRGKSGRVYGNLISLLVMMKGLPLAYNKDMQEDKEAIFDSFDTTLLCLETFTGMIKTMTVNKEEMLKAASYGFINATDCADYLVKKGIAFRQAYSIVGKLVKHCMENNKTLETLTLKEYQSASDVFENDVYEAIDLWTCLNNRLVSSGPSNTSVINQIKNVKEKVAWYEK